MSAHRLASRYAKSILDLAVERGALDTVYQDIMLLDRTIESSRELRVFLKSPIVPTDKKQEVFAKLFGGKMEEITSKFITLLTAKGREGYLHEIASAFIIQYNVIKKITPVTLTSAVKLDQATIDSIVLGLKKKENLTEVQLTETVNPDLIGGFILQYGDYQIDTSVRSSLHQLHTVVADDSYVKRIR
jgi:F-type H+-transporting ATPase subunit delta